MENCGQSLVLEHRPYWLLLTPDACFFGVLLRPPANVGEPDVKLLFGLKYLSFWKVRGRRLGGCGSTA
jgi:hypothetical protein